MEMEERRQLFAREKNVVLRGCYVLVNCILSENVLDNITPIGVY
jgi:hypothetical protein